MPTFDLGNRQIEYSVIKGRSRSYTYFRIRPDLTLEVVVPRGRPVDIEKAISQKAGDIRKEYERAVKTRLILGPETIMYDGRNLKVVLSAKATDELIPDFNSGEVLAPSTDRKQLRELVRRWFLKESSAYVVKKAKELAPKVGAKPSRVDVREIGKWGYCTREGRLSFSWQLIALPERLREYVVFHELTHLVEFNHSPAFRRKLAAVCPDFREREKELDLVRPYDRLTLD
jgi:predicted metal-dependent hydrolase